MQKKHFIGKIVTIKFTDRKEKVTGYLIDYSDDWALLKYNPVDYVVDGYLILKNKNIEKIVVSEREKWTEKILNLKGYKPSTKNTIPLNSLESILLFLTKKFEIFQISTRREKDTFLGRFKSLTTKKLTIDYLTTKATWGGQASFRPGDIRVIQYDNDYINSLKLVQEKRRLKRI